MLSFSRFAAVTYATFAIATAMPQAQKAASSYSEVPYLVAYQCPTMATISYSLSVPDRDPFPKTEVGLCYDDAAGFLHINFTAYNEQYFFYDPDMGTNDALYEYEVMEAFIYQGTNDPQTYLEFEVSPANVTWQAFVYNPSKIRESGAVFDHFFINDPLYDGFSAQTILDRAGQTWNSYVQIPLGLFNIDPGEANGTDWRMNFFRIVESEDTFPNQTYGAWSPVPEPNFHMTPYLGRVHFG
jgi:hypothetical protein